MDRGEQARRARRFRELHQGPKLLLLPNAWDVASARIFEEAGFPAVATTSAGVAFSLGFRDGQAIPLDELLKVVERISSALEVPLSVDGTDQGILSLSGSTRAIRGALAECR